jgi:metallo-beta-lactamase family protein
MNITPFGAAGTVTGSAYLVETDGSSILVDFGAFQGSRELEAGNIVPFEIPVRTLNAVLLTHGHLDHVGRTPMLVREGFTGQFICTEATRSLARLILMDSVRLMESDYQRKVEKAAKKRKKPQRTDLPLFDSEDVEQTMEQVSLIEYDVWQDVAPGITARYVEAGHMLGSASIELQVTEAGTTKHIVFSGDLGPPHLPYLRDPAPPKQADLVVMESTYGDRDHRSLEGSLDEIAEIINDAVQHHGKILIPTFAVGRAQNILYYIAELVRAGKIPQIPIVLDSPMAIEASQIYLEEKDLWDAEATEMNDSGALKKGLAQLELTPDAAESKALNDRHGPMIILAGAGMCNGGRIVHHLRNNLDNPSTHVLIVGYQSYGSLGRKLIDGQKVVMIHGRAIDVNAQIHTIGGLSAHAGQKDLLNWIQPMVTKDLRVVLTHGEDEARKGLFHALKERYGLTAELPHYGQQIGV